MLFSTLLENFQHDISWINKSTEDTDVSSIVTIRKATSYRPGVVYVGELSELKGHLPDKTCFLCYDDAGGEADISGNADVIATPVDVPTIIDGISPCFEELYFLASAMEKLVDVASAGKGMNQLLETAYELTGIPIHVLDADYRFIAYNSAVKEVHPDFKKALEAGRLGEERIRNLERSDMRDALRTFDGLFFFWGEMEQENWLISLIQVESTEVAYFGATVGRKGDPLKYYSLLRFLCKLITLELQKDSFYTWNTDILENVVLNGLIEGSLPNERIELGTVKLRWKPEQDIQILVIEDRDRQIRKETVRGIEGQIRVLAQPLATTVYHGHLVLMVPALERWKEEDIRRFEKLMRVNHLSVGLSANYHTLSHTDKAYQQAKESLGYILNRTLAGPLAFYTDCMYHIMYDVLSGSCDPAQFYHPGVVEIVRNDSEKGAELLNTLEVYLDNIGNPTKAADLLHIHKNTLFYRINKLQLNYGLKLNDGPSRMQVMLTIRFLRASQSSKKALG